MPWGFTSADSTNHGLKTIFSLKKRERERENKEWHSWPAAGHLRTRTRAADRGLHAVPHTAHERPRALVSASLTDTEGQLKHVGDNTGGPRGD